MKLLKDVKMLSSSYLFPYRIAELSIKNFQVNPREKIVATVKANNAIATILPSLTPHLKLLKGDQVLRDSYFFQEQN